MLQTMLGREGFRKGLDLYFERHDGQAVTVEDFVAAMADANRADFSSFLLWYNQAGTPEVEARFTYSEATKSGRLSLSQSYPVEIEGAKRKPLPIPVKLGLVGASGRDLPLKTAEGVVPHNVVMLRKSKETFTFEDLQERPAPSLLRDFSAPVNLKTSLADRDLLHLMRHDSDLFNRWQSAQTLALRQLRGMASALAKGEEQKPNARFIAALGEIAADEALDASFRADFLALPSETMIACEIGSDVDPEAVHRARGAMRASIGRSHRKVFEAVYDRVAPDEPYTPDALNAGRRALRNIILTLLAAGGSRSAFARVKAQAKSAANMTDVLAALSVLTNSGDAAKAPALERFFRRWKDDALVLNKWFALQAIAPGADTLERVLELAKHPQFSMKNPNKVRALYGAFAHGNQVRFNDASGRGYEMVTDAVLELDKFNPQMAARLLTAFENWRLFEPKRRQMAESSLERIGRQAELSKDVYEIGFKIAGGDKQP
jgi:aminopeptidase N